VYKSLVHEDRSYHAGAFIVTIRQQDHEHALGADLAPARTSRSHRRSLRRAGADLMIALHAWRSADSIRTFRERYPDRPLIVA
jgi:hypothetical protein